MEPSYKVVYFSMALPLRVGLRLMDIKQLISKASWTVRLLKLIF